MGHALYSTAPDYMRFLRMYLNKGQLDGKRLLSEKGVETLLSNQIGDIKVGMLKTVVPALTADAEFFPGRKKTHSMAFMRIEEDVPGMRSAGSQFWAGVLNTHCWFDPKKNIAAVLMTQSLPFVEPRFMGVYDRFERAVYAQ
jgi:Beta-lactamase class C and other penicillin binding proteins